MNIGRANYSLHPKLTQRIKSLIEAPPRRQRRFVESVNRSFFPSRLFAQAGVIRCVLSRVYSCFISFAIQHLYFPVFLGNSYAIIQNIYFKSIVCDPVNSGSLSNPNVTGFVAAVVFLVSVFSLNLGRVKLFNLYRIIKIVQIQIVLRVRNC